MELGTNPVKEYIILIPYGCIMLIISKFIFISGK